MRSAIRKTKQRDPPNVRQAFENHAPNWGPDAGAFGRVKQSAGPPDFQVASPTPWVPRATRKAYKGVDTGVTRT